MIKLVDDYLNNRLISLIVSALMNRLKKGNLLEEQHTQRGN